MGSYLGKPGPPPLSPAGGRTHVLRKPINRRPVQPLHQVHRVQYVHRAHPAPPRLRPWRRRLTWGLPTVWEASEAWRSFPLRRLQDSIEGLLPSSLWESYCNFRIWFPRHRAVRSPRTIKIAPPEPRVVPSKSPALVSSVESSPSEKPPDLCARETVLSALRDCTEGRLRRQEPLNPKGLDSERSPDAKTSAFQPLTQDGVRRCFEPRPGPLKRSLDSGSSDHSLSKRRACSSRSSWASTQSGHPASSQRNAITSSYSSSRGLSKRWKRSFPSVSFEIPEWPVKNYQRSPPVPLVSQGSPAASGSARQQNQEAPRPPPSPWTLPPANPPPRLGDMVPQEDPGSGKAGLQQGHETRNDATEVTTASVPDSRPPVPPLPPAGAAPTQGTNPQVGSPGLLAFPQPAGEGSNVAPPPLKTPSLPAPLGCSRSEPLPGPLPAAVLTMAVTLMTSASAASPVAADTTQPPAASRADGPPRPPHPLAFIPVVPPAQWTWFGNVKKPAGQRPATAFPVATSADPTWKCIWGPPPRGEAGDALPSAISVTAAAAPPLGTAAPSSTPVFGTTGPLTTLPGRAPFSFKPAAPPAPPASAHLPHGPLKADAAAASTASTAPASASKDFSFKLPAGCDAAALASTVGSSLSLLSPGHTSLPGAAQAGTASFSPAAGFTVSSHQRPPTPTARSVPAFSQALPGAVQIAPRGSTADPRGTGSPLAASAPLPSKQPALSSGASNPTSTFTAPWGSSSKPLSQLPLGVTPQPAWGSSGDQKPRAPQFGPSFNSTFIFGNSAAPPPTPAPTASPAQPAFSSHTQPAFGAQTPSASTFHPRPGFGSTPAAFPFGQATATSFGVVARALQTGACGSVFGSTAPRPFAFGGLVTPMDCEESGVSVTTPGKSSTPGVFCFGATLGGATHRASTPFGKVCPPSTQGLTDHSAPFASGRASISARKTVFRAPHMVPFAQSTPAPGPVKTGSGVGFGVPSPHAQGSIAGGYFRPPAPPFAFSAKPKTPKHRGAQGRSRRRHAHRR